MASTGENADNFFQTVKICYSDYICHNEVNLGYGNNEYNDHGFWIQFDESEPQNILSKHNNIML